MLKGKAAVVTGSTSGIGLGIARALAKEGADLLLNGFADEAEINRLKASLAGEFGVKVFYSPADMSKPNDIALMIQYATTALGRGDILVTTAGIQHTAPIESFPPEKCDAIIAINLSAAFPAIRPALPQLKARHCAAAS